MKDNRVAVALVLLCQSQKMALSQTEQRHTQPSRERRRFQMTMLAVLSEHRQVFSSPTSEAAGAEAEAAAQVAEEQVDVEAPADAVAPADAEASADAEEAVAALQQEFALSAG